MESRLANLERSPRLQASSIGEGGLTVTDGGRIQVEGGAIVVRNTAGTVVGVLGDGNGDGVSGLQVAADNTAPVLTVTENEGIVQPILPLPMTRTAPEVVTSASFAATHEHRLQAATGNAIRLEAAIGTDVGTTAEARIRLAAGSDTYSAVQSVPSGSAPTLIWAWSAPSLIVGAGTYLVQLEVRRTSGAGNVYVYPPGAGMTGASLIGATTTGV
jgi:hypothetical protein